MSRIALSPWSRQKMDPIALAVLEQRAWALGCWVSTVLRIRGRREWVVRAFSTERTVELRAQGSLAAIIAGCLDDYETATEAA